MPQRFVPAVFLGGGTSKGLFFQAKDLPADPEHRDRVLLAALGSPDPFGRQLDGMGGGLSSAVGAFAVDQGLCPRTDGPAMVRIHNTNTGGLIHARFAVRGGCAETRGELAIPGVAGTGAPIRLDFLDPGGARTGRLLPTGRPVDEVALDRCTARPGR